MIEMNFVVDENFNLFLYIFLFTDILQLQSRFKFSVMFCENVYTMFNIILTHLESANVLLYITLSSLIVFLLMLLIKPPLLISVFTVIRVSTDMEVTWNI